MILAFLCLSLLTPFDQLYFLPCDWKWRYFTLLCGWVALRYRTSASSSAYPSARWQVGCFPVLAVVPSATGILGVQVSFKVLFFSKSMPRCGICGSYGDSVEFFMRNSIFFFLVDISVCFSSKPLQEGLPALHTLQHLLSQVFFKRPFDRVSW